jgi:hypothetical protein
MTEMDPATHKRFLDYRERFTYFGRGGMKRLTPDEFMVADADHRALEAKGDDRDDEEEARLADLAKLLFRD